MKKGQKVAFVGSSGCGKSTITQILLRFYDQDSGEILIDGKPIQDYDLHYLRDCFGVVSQEPVLFNGSFNYNIKYNQGDVTAKDIENSAKYASAYEFIKGD